MERNLVKRLMTKDGSQRISFYREDDAESPRYMTDEPLHCEDFSRDYSIMTKEEREHKSTSARNLIIHFLGLYGKREKIVDMLVENGKHMTDGKSVCNNALVYDKSMKRWVLKEYTKWYGDKDYEWKDAAYFDGRKDDIDIVELADVCLDSTIDELQYYKYWTDGIKMASYGFGYYGEVSFYDEVTCESDGIAWLEKDEFLKYSGQSEDYWNSKSLKEIEFLLDEIESWSNGEVYEFVVEKAIRTQVMKTYFNGEREDESYIETEWVEEDSCWGFYGEFDKAEEWMLEEADIKKEELEEVSI